MGHSNRNSPTDVTALVASDVDAYGKEVDGLADVQPSKPASSTQNMVTKRKSFVVVDECDAPDSSKKKGRGTRSVNECTNNAVAGGVCRKHGYPCNHEGCTNYAIRGVKRKICSHEGCAYQVVRGGVCSRHGAKVKSAVTKER